MGSPKDSSPASETQRLIAETLRMPLDKTVQDAFTPRQKALLRELEELDADKDGTDANAGGNPA
jgi:hypothetical protein